MEDALVTAIILKMKQMSPEELHHFISISTQYLQGDKSSVSALEKRSSKVQ